jgi:hypothetical protein
MAENGKYPTNFRESRSSGILRKYIRSYTPWSEAEKNIVHDFYIIFNFICKERLTTDVLQVLDVFLLELLVLDK